ncbi:hypothetical protein ACJJTC_015961 [Scirpophaga incertulas]
MKNMATQATTRSVQSAPYAENGTVLREQEWPTTKDSIDLVNKSSPIRTNASGTRAREASNKLITVEQRHPSPSPDDISGSVARPHPFYCTTGKSTSRRIKRYPSAKRESRDSGRKTAPKTKGQFFRTNKNNNKNFQPPTRVVFNVGDKKYETPVTNHLRGPTRSGRYFSGKRPFAESCQPPLLSAAPGGRREKKLKTPTPPRELGLHPQQDRISPVKNSSRSSTPSKPIAPYSLVSRLRPALYPEKIGQNHPSGLEKQSRRSVAP